MIFICFIYLFYLLVCAATYRDTHVRPDFYCEKWLPQYVETDFYKHFRMSRELFSQLLSVVTKYDTPKCDHGGYTPISQEKCLLVTIWYLSKGETIASIGDRFNLSDSTIFHITDKYIEIIAELTNTYIKWPNEEECTLIEQQFASIAGYPGIIAAVDGCHIPCKVPDNVQSSYCNRKQQHSIILQGICTANYIFSNIFVGYPGSVHDSKVFQNCGLYESNINDGVEKYIYDKKYHILGDSAYFLREWLITPYIDNGRLSRAEVHHNVCHSRSRVVIENTFGRLKGRWRILQYVNVYSIKKVIQITTACCVLHNFTHLLGDVSEVDIEYSDGNEVPVSECTSNHSILGTRKRNEIKENLKN